MRKLTFYLLSLFLLMFIAGCGPSGPTPKEVVKTTLEALKTFDLQALQKLEGSTKDPFEKTPPEYVKIIKSALSKMEYFVGGDRIQGDRATVNVTIISINLAEVIQKALPQIMGQALTGGDVEAKTMQIIDETINNPKVIKQSTDVQVLLAKSNNEWIILGGKDNEALQKAMFGDIKN